MIKRFNHVGIAVKDLDKAMAFFEEVYGARLIGRDRYEDQQFETAMVGIGEMRLELIASLDPGSFIAGFIKERGDGIHHMSLEVDQFEQVIDDFKAKGSRYWVKRRTPISRRLSSILRETLGSLLKS